MGQLAHGIGAEFYAYLRPGGQNVGINSTVGNDAVYMNIGRKAFPPCVDQIQEFPGGGQGVVPLPGGGNRMGLLALELHQVAFQTQQIHVGQALSAAPAVNHDGQGHFIKGSLSGHGDLGSQHRHGAMHIVAAGVPQTRQCVILHQDSGRGTVAVV